MRSLVNTDWILKDSQSWHSEAETCCQKLSEMTINFLNFIFDFILHSLVKITKLCKAGNYLSTNLPYALCIIFLYPWLNNFSESATSSCCRCVHGQMVLLGSNKLLCQIHKCSSMGLADNKPWILSRSKWGGSTAICRRRWLWNFRMASEICELLKCPSSGSHRRWFDYSILNEIVAQQHSSNFRLSLNKIRSIQVHLSGISGTIKWYWRLRRLVKR